MKKLIPFGALCILACVIFSSCSSSFEITKRRYNKGYYINHSGNKEMALITKEKAAQSKITAPAYPVQAITEQNTQAVSSIQPYKGKDVTTATNLQHKAVLATNAGVMIKNLPTATEAPSVQMQSSITGINKVTDDDHNRRDALSLFWLIILIVLIVWVIGLIAGGFGLGGFINILLIIALILLILWLLRIV